MVEPNSKANEPKRAKGSVITNYFLLILFIFGCIQFFINVQQDNNGDYHQKKHIEAFQRKHFDKARLKKLLKFNKKMHDLNEGGNHETIEVEEEVDEQNSEEEEDPLERERETLVGLNCDPHGGPSNDLAEEMVFWEGKSSYFRVLKRSENDILQLVFVVKIFRVTTHIFLLSKKKGKNSILPLNRITVS